MAAKLISLYRPISVLFGLITLYVSLSKGMGVVDAVFRGMVVFCGAMILALLGHNVYLLMALKAQKRAEAEERKRRLEEKRAQEEAEKTKEADEAAAAINRQPA